MSSLVSELSVQSLYEAMPSMETSLAAFRAAGFQVAGLFNVHADEEIRPMIECNCYCVRRPEAVSI